VFVFSQPLLRDYCHIGKDRLARGVSQKGLNNGGRPIRFRHIIACGKHNVTATHRRKHFRDVPSDAQVRSVPIENDLMGPVIARRHSLHYLECAIGGAVVRKYYFQWRISLGESALHGLSDESLLVVSENGERNKRAFFDFDVHFQSPPQLNLWVHGGSGNRPRL